MSDLDLGAIEITGVDEYPADSSVKLNGPPGTGKTTESAARVATLLEEYGYELSDVLWATYRRSLAMETLERLADWDVIPQSELSDPSDGPTRHISTMHAVASRMVGGVGEPVNYGDKKRYCEKRNLRYHKNSAWDQPPGRLLFDVFTYAANNLLDLRDPRDCDQIPMVEDLRDKYRGDLGRAWEAWQDYKAQNEKIDFYEQLKAPLQRNVTPNQDIVVIDEYHDATPLMAKLAESWIESAEIAIVAGDPLQVVNTYAGARPQFYKRVDLPEIQLPKAWKRPPQQHWAAATSLLKNAHEPPEVEIANNGSIHVGESPGFSHSDGEWHVPSVNEARSPGWVIDEYGTDTMFLARTQKQASGVARALEKAGVLFETQSSMDIDGWGAREDVAERTALYNALQRIQGVEGELRSGGGLSRYDNSGDKTLDDVKLRHQEAAALIDHASAKHLAGSRDDVTEFANEIQNSETVVDGPDIAEYTKAEFWDVYSRGAGAVRHLNKSSYRNGGETLTDRDRGALQAAIEANDGPVKTVDTLVYTIHASKGSEAKNVVLYDGVTNRIRAAMQESERERKNEWRTWYVAFTRSRANLFVLKDGFEWTKPFLPGNLLISAREAEDVEVDV